MSFLNSERVVFGATTQYEYCTVPPSGYLRSSIAPPPSYKVLYTCQSRCSSHLYLWRFEMWLVLKYVVLSRQTNIAWRTIRKRAKKPFVTHPTAALKKRNRNSGQQRQSHETDHRIPFWLDTHLRIHFVLALLHHHQQLLTLSITNTPVGE